MRTLVTCKRNLVWILLLSLGVVTAQERYKESFDASKDMVVSVNTAYANVIFETWNKDKVEVEAFVDGEDLTKEERKKIFDDWKLEVLGNSKKVVVTSHASKFGEGIGAIAGLEALKSLESLNALESMESLKGLEALKNLEAMPKFDFNFDFKVPDVPEFKEIPTWPFSKATPNIAHKGKGMSLHFGGNDGIVFNKSEYQKDKKAYVAKLNKKYDTKVSVREVDEWLAEVDAWASEFEKVMEDWGESFGKEFSEKFSPDFEKKMEKWGEEFGEKFGKEMEQWGEQFGKEMEKWGESFGKEMEEWAKQFEGNAENWEHKGNNGYFYEGGNNVPFNGKANKTIIIRMPKNTKTEVNVRYGELKMASAYNIKATLNYATLTANSIDGGKTLINASYAPVYVNSWEDGALQVNYVEDCRLNTVRAINLQSNSSDVNINEILRSAMLSGSFGNLFVSKVANDFQSIDIVLENTDAALKLPNTAFSFYFNGKKSHFESPNSLTLKETKSFDRKLLKGYHQSNTSGKSITINANYSNVSVE